MSRKSSSSTTSQAVSTNNLNTERGITAVSGARVTVTDANSTRNALNANEAVSIAAIDSATDALRASLDFAGENVEDYYSASGYMVDRTYDFLETTTADVFDTIRESEARTVGAVLDAAGEAIATVSANARTESEAALSEVGSWVKWIAGGAALVFAVKAWGKA